MKDHAAAGNSVQALSRGLRLLSEVLAAGVPIGLGDLAARTRLPKPTALRLLRTMLQDGYVTRLPDTGLYAIGPSLASWLRTSALELALASVARPTMRALRDRSGETVALYIPVWPDRVCIEQVESLSGLRRVHRIGEKWPLTLGASGRAYLAFVGEQVLERVLAIRPLEPVTPATTTDEQEFRDQLIQVRQDGYAVSSSEAIVGMGGVAAPVFGSGTEPIAMISVSGPVDRWSLDRMRAFAPVLLEATHNLSQAMRQVRSEETQAP